MSNRGYSRFGNLNIVGCLHKKRLIKGGSWAPQDPPPPLPSYTLEVNHKELKQSKHVTRNRKYLNRKKQEKAGSEHFTCQDSGLLLISFSFLPGNTRNFSD